MLLIMVPGLNPFRNYDSQHPSGKKKKSFPWPSSNKKCTKHQAVGSLAPIPHRPGLKAEAKFSTNLLGLAAPGLALAGLGFFSFLWCFFNDHGGFLVVFGGFFWWFFMTVYHVVGL